MGWGAVSDGQFRVVLAGYLVLAGYVKQEAVESAGKCRECKEVKVENSLERAREVSPGRGCRTWGILECGII